MSQLSDSSPVLILGGNGYLGSHLVEELLGLGCPVRVLSRRRTGLLPQSLLESPLLEYVLGDLSDSSACREALKGCSAVVHCIGPDLPSASNHNPALDWHQHVEPTLMFLRLLRDEPAIRFLFISSGGTVYGPNCVVPTPEGATCQPISAYGIHKLAIENFLFLEHYLFGLDYSIARIANPYGGRQRSQSLQGAPTVFLYKVLKGEPIDLWGNGSVRRDFIHIFDATDALIRMLKYKGNSRILNIGSSRSLSMIALIEKIETLTGRKAVINWLPQRPFDVAASELSIDLARAELDWCPMVQLDDGLMSSIERFNQLSNGQ